MKKQKLLLIIEAMGGGGGRHVQDIINHLDQRYFDIYCIYSTKRAEKKFLRQIDVFQEKAEMIPCDDLVREISIKQDIAAYRFIAEKIAEIQPDIVHCHSSKAGVIGRVAAKRQRIKKIFYTPHGYSFRAAEFSNRKKKLFATIERFLSRWTTRTFCVSEGEKADAVKHKIDSGEKIAVIYNGIPNIELPEKLMVRKKLNLPADAILIGNNARMCDPKNPKLFLQIARTISQQYDNYHFVWAGDGELFSEAQHYVAAHRLEKNVHLLGHREDSEQIVAGYDILMLTSTSEGLPYSALEALRAGVPILGTKIAGLDEIINTKTGRFLSTHFGLHTLEELICLSPQEVKSDFYKKFSLDKMIATLTKHYQSSV